MVGTLEKAGGRSLEPLVSRGDLAAATFAGGTGHYLSTHSTKLWMAWPITAATNSISMTSTRGLGGLPTTW
jgi:hypothetical protein